MSVKSPDAQVSLEELITNFGTDVNVRKCQNHFLRENVILAHTDVDTMSSVHYQEQ